MPRVGSRWVMDDAVMGSHTVAVLRRSGDTFSPINSGDTVCLGEPIRYRANGVKFGGQVRFVVTDSIGSRTLLDQEAGVQLLSGDAWLDTVAPQDAGDYKFDAHARTYPFLPFSHIAQIGFRVNKDCTPPPKPPPKSDFLKDIKGILIAAAVIVGIVLVAPILTRAGVRD